MPGGRGPRQRRLCLVVDIEAYSGRPYAAQQSAQSRLARALDHACELAGVSRRSCELQDRGDGQLLLLPPGADEGRVVPGLVLGLRDALFTLNAHGAAAEAVRLRAALAQGSVQRAPLGYVAWSVELACRLLDSASLRKDLASAKDSDMALIVPADLYADVFATGAGGVPAAAFRRVRIDIPEKRFTADAWISALPPGTPAALGPAQPRRPAGGRGGRIVAGALAAGAGLTLLLPDEGDTAHAASAARPTEGHRPGEEPRPHEPEHHEPDHHEPPHPEDPKPYEPHHDSYHDEPQPDPYHDEAHHDPYHEDSHQPQPDPHHEDFHPVAEGDALMTDTDPTWDDGNLTEHDVIESADHTGYTSVSDYVAGENGYEPDPPSTDHGGDTIW
jgi:hypothetical protein